MQKQYRISSPPNQPEFCQILPHDDNHLDMNTSPFFLPLGDTTAPSKGKAHII
jgi:hypothetical protein